MYLFHVLIDTEECYCMHDRLPTKWIVFRVT